METSLVHDTNERAGTGTGSAATGQGGYGERQGGAGRRGGGIDVVPGLE